LGFEGSDHFLDVSRPGVVGEGHPMENGGGVSGAQDTTGEGSDQAETSPVGEAVGKTVSTCVHDRKGGYCYR
jgi:hypothetical protein